MPLRTLPTTMLMLQFVLFLACLPVHADDSMGMVWKGTVTFSYSHSPRPDESYVSDDKKTASHKTVITSRFTATAFVCGVGLGRGYVQSASADYMESTEDILNYKESRCEPEGEIKRPGYSKEMKGSYQAIVAPGFIKTPVNSSLTITLTPSGEMKYKLAVALPDVPMAIRVGFAESRSSDPCSGGKSSHKIAMMAGSALPERTECTDDGSHCQSHVHGTPLGYPLSVIHEGTMSGENIIGSTTVTPKAYGDAVTSSLQSGIKEMMEHMPPEMKAEIEGELAKIPSQEEDRPPHDGSGEEGDIPYQIRVSWNLKRVSPCDAVIDQLRQDLAMIMAYGDHELLDQAKREGWKGKKYDNGVFELGVKYYQAEWWQSGSLPNSEGIKPEDKHDTASMDMALDDETCSIDPEKQKQARENQRRSCTPDIIYESILEHEKTHAKQCMSDKTAAEYTSQTPESYRKFEHEAYCVGARHLLDWAEEVCPEPDVKPLSEAYNTYCD